MERNVGSTDRIVRMGVGLLVLVGAAVLASGIVGVSGTVTTVAVPAVLAVVGLVLVVTGYTQSCPAYQLIGMRTLKR